MHVSSRLDRFQSSAGLRCSACILVLLAAGCLEPPPSPPSSSSAADFVSPALEERMQAAADRIAQRGFRAAEEPQRGFVVERMALVSAAQLPTGRCQVFVAVGSSALREIWLEVFDSAGSEMAETRSTGSGAALHFCPDLPGTHYVSVRAIAGDGLLATRRFEGPSGIELDLEDLFQPEPPPAQVRTP